MASKTTSTTARTEIDKTACPKGEDICPIFGEIEHLRQEVRTDPLTGLFNRRQLWHTLDQEMERTRRSLQPTSLILLDIDFFKQVNDNYGHVTGDRVLKNLAQQLLTATRKLDVACRYGGEEFAIVLPSTPLTTGVQVAERLRNQVASTPIVVDGIPHSITISLGIDSYSSQNLPGIDEFIQRVDDRLYQAKRSGRNCVQFGLPTSAVRASVAQDEKQALSEVFSESPD
jgi:diguanylate cyclase (GGDEF)-like protein